MRDGHLYLTLRVLLLFIAVVLLLEGVYMLWNASQGPEAKRIERRLQAMSAGAHGGATASSLAQAAAAERVAAGCRRCCCGMPRVASPRPPADAVGPAAGRVASSSALTLAWPLAGVALPALLRSAAGHCCWSWRCAAAPAALCCTSADAAQQAPAADRPAVARRARPDGRALRAGHAFPSALQDGRRRDGQSRSPASSASRSTRSTTASRCRMR